MKTKDRKISCNKKWFKTLNKVIEENNIGKKDDTLKHVSSEEEVPSEEEIVKGLFDNDMDMSSSSNNLEDKESEFIVIDDDNVEDKDNNIFKSNDDSN